MTDTLKAVGNIGAELAAAKADLQREMERHRKTWRELEQARGLLNECSGQIDLLIEIYEEDDAEPDDIAICEQIKSDISAALSQQAEPVCRCTMSQRVLGDGCSVCNPELAAELAAEDEDDEPAPAQDERCGDARHNEWVGDNWPCPTCAAIADYKATRPAQTEQPEQGVAMDAQRYRWLRINGGRTFSNTATGGACHWGSLRCVRRRGHVHPREQQAMIDVITDNTDTLYAALREIDRLRDENERLVREAKNDAIAYRAVIERQEELRAELDALKAQRGEAVAWAVANSVDEIGGFAPIYYTEEGAIRWANGKNIIALCAVPPAIDALVEALEAIVRQHPNPDISHVDYRVHACKQAEHGLETYRASQRKEG